jgi:TRAP-type uncharacterized transport system substrate-binding protein
MRRDTLPLLRKYSLIGVLVISWCLSAGAEAQTLVERVNGGVVKLITGPDATSVQMAQELANVVDDGVTRRVLPVVGRGFMQNLIDLKLLRGIDVAVVRSDAFEDARALTSWLGPLDSLTYITKLYNEELHVLTRTGINNIAELEGKRVNFVRSAGPIGPAIFKLLKITVEPASDDAAAALQKLKDGQIAALVYVGGKPIPLFDPVSKPQDLHFLPVSLDAQTMPSMYVPARITAEDYPNLVAADTPIDTVAVSNVLLAAPLQPKSDRYRNVANFVEAFFTQLPRLREAGHNEKWKDVDLGSIVPGLRRFPAAETWLKRNEAASSAQSEPELREAFARFLDERSRLSGTGGMTATQKDEMFSLFQQWLKSQPR